MNHVDISNVLDQLAIPERFGVVKVLNTALEMFHAGLLPTVTVEEGGHLITFGFGITKVEEIKQEPTDEV